MAQVHHMPLSIKTVHMTQVNLTRITKCLFALSNLMSLVLKEGHLHLRSIKSTIKVK